MNPNAVAFVPFTKHDHAEQRKTQRNREALDLQHQIFELKQLLAVENEELVAIHAKLKNHYAVLSTHIAQEKDTNYPHPVYNAYMTSLLRQEYQAQSDKYYAKYTNYNDLTSELVTLDQRLHAILMHPDSQSNSNTETNAAEKCVYPHQLQQNLSAMDGIKKNMTPTPHHALASIMESEEEYLTDIDDCIHFYDDDTSEHSSSEYYTFSD